MIPNGAMIGRSINAVEKKWLKKDLDRLDDPEAFEKEVLRTYGDDVQIQERIKEDVNGH